jgi:hypothetical protein
MFILFCSPPIISALKTMEVPVGAAFKLTQEELSNDHAGPVGKVRGHEFFDLGNKLLGYIKGEEIYTATHVKVAYVRIGNVYDLNNKKMISLSDAQKMMNCHYEGVALAGYWYFFGRASKKITL